MFPIYPITPEPRFPTNPPVNDGWAETRSDPQPIMERIMKQLAEMTATMRRIETKLDNDRRK